MDLEEPSRGSEGLGSLGHHRHILAVADGFAVAGTRPLHAVGAVHDDRRDDAEHVGDIAEIDNKIVIAETVAALGEPHIGGTALTGFLDRIAHVGTGEKLGFLDVHGLARLGGSNDEVGLTAEESRNLNDINDLADG